MNLPASGAAAALGPTAQERKDVERFVKFLAHKMVQVVVQSRLGEKASTPCRQLPSSGDWFNLAVDDIAEVAAETRKALDGRIPQPGGPALHVEISLRTVEGDQLVLEDWSLSASQAAEPQGRVTYTVYSRMSLLLKSIITVSRITPAYKLSGRQGADTFVLCYRVHTGRPRDLGEQPQSRVLGRVDTPIGGFNTFDRRAGSSTLRDLFNRRLFSAAGLPDAADAAAQGRTADAGQERPLHTGAQSETLPPAATAPAAEQQRQQRPGCHLRRVTGDWQNGGQQVHLDKWMPMGVCLGCRTPVGCS